MLLLPAFRLIRLFTRADWIRVLFKSYKKLQRFPKMNKQRCHVDPRKMKKEMRKEKKERRKNKKQARTFKDLRVIAMNWP